LLLVRLGLIGTAAAVGATLAASPTSIPLMLAITLAAQMLVVGERAKHRRCHRAIEARTPAGSASSELTQPRSINSILY
jgi:hypothetical protein